MAKSAHAYEPKADLMCILVLPTTHRTLLAEEILQSENIRYSPIPKPLKAISECGMALRLQYESLSQAAKSLEKMDVTFYLQKADGEIALIRSEDIK